MCTGRRDIAEILLKTTLNNIQSIISLSLIIGESHSSVGTVQDMRIADHWFDPLLGQYSFQGSFRDRIHSPLTAVCCFDNGYVGKQPVAWKEYCSDYWLKELKKHGPFTEILLKMAFSTMHRSDTANYCLDDSHVEKQPTTSKENCTKHSA